MKLMSTKATNSGCLQLVEDVLDVAGGDGVLGAVLEGRVDGEIARRVRRSGRPWPKNAKMTRLSLVASLVDPVERLEDVLAGGRLAAALLVRTAQQQLDVLRLDAEVFLGRKQIVQRLGVRLGVLARLDLRIVVLVDAHEHDIRLGRFFFGGAGDRRDQARTHNDQQTPHASEHERSFRLGKMREILGRFCYCDGRATPHQLTNILIFSDPSGVVHDGAMHFHRTRNPEF